MRALLLPLSLALAADPSLAEVLLAFGDATTDRLHEALPDAWTWRNPAPPPFYLNLN